MKRKYCLRVMLLPFLMLTELLHPQTITGKVLRADTHEPVPNASVHLLKANTGTITDGSGSFNLKLISADTLIVSHVNYVDKIIIVNPVTTHVVVIELNERNSQQDEVVVIGYGTTTKRFNTGSVAQVSAKVISQQPVSNPLAAIQGRAAGVFVNTQNGLPGGNISIQIRGKNSLQAGNNPLFVIDGVPFISTPLNTGKADLLFANDAISPLNSINPADIASIEILKDADATAIYGSRAANGVVLITTKKGEAGDTRGNIKIYEGVSRVAHYADLLNIQQYLMMRREAFTNDGAMPDEYSAPDLVLWDTTKAMDWQRWVFGGTAHVTDVQAGVSGGSGNTRFLLSSNYRHETSILPGEQYYKRGGFHFSMEHRSANNKLNISFSNTYSKDKNVLPPPVYGYALLPPNFPLYDNEGKLNWSLYTLNPAAALMQQTKSETESFISNAVISYEVSKGLQVKVSAGYTKIQLEQWAKKPAASLNPMFGEANNAVFGDNSNTSYIIEPQLLYAATFGKSSINAIAGSTWQKSISEGSTIKGSGYSNEALMESLSAAEKIDYVVNNFNDYRYVSVFGRLNYRYSNRYIIDASFRRDGSSRFGPGRRFGNFGAGGAAWLFGEEKFFKRSFPFVQFGKLRASYGIVGNDQIADYQYLGAYAPGVSYAGTGTFYPVRIANPNYGWETTKKFEAALELGVLNNRVQVTIDWYRNRSSNQLIQYPLPSQTGFTSYQYNLPALVQNTGWEFELNTTNVKTKYFKWESNFNLTAPKNKLVKFPGLATSSFVNTYVVGESIDVWKAFHFTGIDAATGIPGYEDVNKDGIISFPDDYVLAGNRGPKLYGGLNNAFSWRGFDLTVFIQFVEQKGIMPISLPGFDYFSNNYSYVLNRWQKPGDITTIPKATTTYGSDAWLANSRLPSSSAVFGDASYTRLKTVSFSYTLPVALTTKMKVRNLRLYTEAQNIFTISNNKRLDPELLTADGGMPPLRTYAAGIEITF